MYSVFLRMMKSVSSFLKENESLSAMEATTILNKKIELLVSEVEATMDFLVKEDKALKVNIKTATERVAAPLFAVIKTLEIHYTKNSNPAMVASLHVTHTEVKYATCKTLDGIVKKVMKIAREGIKELAIYNITEALLDKLEADMLVLVAANDSMQRYQKERKGRKDELDKAIEEGKKLLEEADMLVDIISLTNSNDYKAYQKIRNKKEYSERLFTIIVLNDQTGRPEENARVLVQSTTRMVNNRPFVLIDRKTGKTGEIRYNKRDFDIYQLTVEKMGCEKVKQELTLADNTPIRIEVRLKKAEGAKRG